MTRIDGRSFTRSRIGGGAAGVALALALTVAPAALAADHTVDIVGFSFSPQTITIQVGDSVTWANSDAQGHTATADDGSWTTPTIGGNTSQALTFTTAGTFAYHCAIHRQMTATLVVTDAAPATDTTPVATRDAGSVPGALVLAAAATLGLLAGARRFGRRLPR